MTGIPCRVCHYFNLPIMNKCVMCKATMPPDSEKVQILFEQVQRLETQLAAYVNAEVGPPSVEPPPPPPSEKLPPKARMVFYNKRDQYFRDPTLMAQRLDATRNHAPLPFPNQRQLSCVWCCRAKHTTTMGNHSRHGCKTSVHCAECNVALCQRDRGNGGVSCFDQFHAAHELNNPCQPSSSSECVALASSSSSLLPTNGTALLTTAMTTVARRKTPTVTKVPRVRSKSAYVLTTLPRSKGGESI
ncbi:hypothetical protein SPRG_14986 [Saprolegnia parasitica CBS 223.65]|uniref:PiggyBac transposable element-derived protein 4 C-terminal zinc-ribbon domain-containing protein n=1 Tax=Saprolegnia parasitica (strain CBS 223.65) TaxID=695850 RepID=A0A067BZ08_SAPPC|nr:hypothetical protein SPRG_14986 [Saprolegnia parasitica CBS 223.65]KDO19792.1 hypothetical protein SPRG_14986 [Saprolegnia parasitica CBS 223.65]|eukprot:XP_012209500.1 hypothetical protein SPRG_14986 [Saprolegnia parasitica CBS 223.65]